LVLCAVLMKLVRLMTVVPERLIEASSFSSSKDEEALSEAW
jgi:hypothetical protein